MEGEIEYIKNKLSLLTKCFLFSLVILISLIAYLLYKQNQNSITEHSIMCNLDDVGNRLTTLILNLKHVTEMSPEQTLDWITKTSYNSCIYR